MSKENVVLVKTDDFAVRMVKLVQILQSDKQEYVLSKQILRSATSIGANAEEAIGGISKADYRAKMGISYKEARETQYWLRLLRDTDYIDHNTNNSLNKNLEEILKITYTIVKNSTERK